MKLRTKLFPHTVPSYTHVHCYKMKWNICSCLIIYQYYLSLPSFSCFVCPFVPYNQFLILYIIFNFPNIKSFSPSIQSSQLNASRCLTSKYRDLANVYIYFLLLSSTIISFLFLLASSGLDKIHPTFSTIPCIHLSIRYKQWIQSN